MAGLSEVPVVVRDADEGQVQLELALVENLQRQDLNPIEEAEGYQRLMAEFAYTQETLAGRRVTGLASAVYCNVGQPLPKDFARPEVRWVAWEEGGRLPDEWRTTIRRAIEQGMDIWSGLHTFISDDQELRELAARHGVAIHDLRRPPPDLPVAAGRVRAVDAFAELPDATALAAANKRIANILKQAEGATEADVIAALKKDADDDRAGGDRESRSTGCTRDRAAPRCRRATRRTRW